MTMEIQISIISSDRMGVNIRSHHIKPGIHDASFNDLIFRGYENRENRFSKQYKIIEYYVCHTKRNVVLQKNRIWCWGDIIAIQYLSGEFYYLNHNYPVSDIMFSIECDKYRYHGINIQDAQEI
jgi:hypothetical protein